MLELALFTSIAFAADEELARHHSRNRRENRNIEEGTMGRLR
jgi:hypothetical protein